RRLTAAIDDDAPVGSMTPSLSRGYADALRSSALRATCSPCAPMHSTVCTTSPLSGISSAQSIGESVTRTPTLRRMNRARLTRLRYQFPDERCQGETPSENSFGRERSGFFLRAMLTRAGNLSPVAAKHQLLDVIGDRFAERQEARACLSRRRARDDLRRQVQWL